MKILLHGLNYAPEELGIGKYSGEMIQSLAEDGHRCVVVTTPPYYPHWKIRKGYRGWRYSKETDPVETPDQSRGGAESIEVIRCPLWVPKQVTGLKRVIHLATFGLSSVPAVLWKALTFRPDVIMTVEPAAFCLPTTWLSARLCGAKAWLHVQDFEVDAAFDLGILKSPMLQKLVLSIESFLMKRFDAVSSISPNMMRKLVRKGVREERTCLFPNWVDCDAMRPLGEGSVPHDLAALREELQIPTDRFVALYAGNIGAKQGLDLLIETARVAAKNENSSVHFVICGNGAAYAELAAQAEGLANVQLLPVQPFEKFNELMNCADVHLLPQKAGAADLVMPSKLTGMLATGRPVIACAESGTQIAEVVEGRGLVVEPGDARSLGEAIARLANDTTTCELMGVAARKYAVENLSRAAILSRLQADLYRVVGEPLLDRSTALEDNSEVAPSESEALPVSAPHFGTSQKSDGKPAYSDQPTSASDAG